MALCSYNSAEEFKFNKGAQMEILEEHQEFWVVMLLSTKEVGRIPRRSRSAEVTTAPMEIPSEEESSAGGVDTGQAAPPPDPWMQGAYRTDEGGERMDTSTSKPENTYFPQVSERHI